jgi:hypothetical protein
MLEGDGRLCEDEGYVGFWGMHFLGSEGMEEELL